MNEEDLIKKWLDNDLSAEELVKFQQLEGYDSFMKLSDRALRFKAPTFDKEASYAKVSDYISKKRLKKSRLQRLRPYVQIAALFVIGFTVYSLFFSSVLTIEQTLAQQKTVVDLPDTSVVELNSLSEISFDEKKWKNDRHLNLKGEAFFKVAKGSKFDVETTSGTVSVVGTQFNVKNREGYFEVKCFEGLVSVAYMNKEYLLPAGKSLRVINENVFLNSTKLLKPTWIDNFSTFKSVPLFEVIAEFERQYDYEVEVPEGFDDTLLYSGKFVHNDKNLAIQSITLPFNFDYSIIKNKIIFKKFE
jgi:transmembrane sensor